jgi:hypothetical protein
MKTIVTALALLGLASTLAEASTSCVTRRSGSTTITSCSDSGHKSNYRQCRIVSQRLGHEDELQLDDRRADPRQNPILILVHGRGRPFLWRLHLTLLLHSIQK